MRPSSHYPGTQAAIVDNFRRGTIGPMREATSSVRLTIEQSLEAIGSTRAALVQVNELARIIDAALANRRAVDGPTRDAGRGVFNRKTLEDNAW
jgi:hypothetical protein